MFKELPINIAGDLVLDKGKSIISEYKEKKQWKKLFVDTNEFLLKKVEQGDKLLDEISEYLTSDEIKRVARNLTQESKYELIEKMHSELAKLMMKYEIPQNEANYYISGFINVIFHELEKVNPDYYQCAFLGDWRKKEEESLENIKNELAVMSTAISSIKKDNILIYTAEQIEAELYKNTINPRLDLGFFEIDDEVFQEDFEEALSKDNIYIKGQCKEETLYCILYELRKIIPEKLVLVVKSEKDWEKLRAANEKEEIGGKILIPWFYAEQIISISNNTNIFVFGSEEQVVGKPTIELRKRKRGTVREKLEKLGMSYENAYRLVEDTHGLFIPMKKKLINGVDLKTPSWVNGNRNIIIPLLLCGKWTESEGDTMVIEELSGMRYQDIIQSIQPYINGENPLFVRFKQHGRTIYHLASTENAWGYLDDYVDFESDLWEKYVEYISVIICENNPIYDFPIEQRSYANILPGGSSCWSSTLKEGLLGSLVMKAYYNNKPQNQGTIDSIVTKILENIKSNKQWLSIAKFFPILCEASPVAVEKRLDEEWNNETGLKELFTEQNDDSLMARNEYTNIIWGVEQFLCQKEHAVWAIRWLFKMNEIRREYAITNSPYDTLSKVFCAWLNISVLSQDEKIQLAKEVFSARYDVWDLFYSELPGVKTSIMSTISKPRYRMVSDPRELTDKDVINAYKTYIDLCIGNMEFKTYRWEKIINHINHFDRKTIQKIIDVLLYEIKSMDDGERITIKERIRGEIYRNRYFNSSEWSMKETEIELLEKLIQDISTQNPIYEYRYLFKSRYDFPLLKPYPFDDNKTSKLNDELIEEEIREGIISFKEDNLDIIQLAEICSEFDYSSLGYYIFSMYSNNQFDEELYVRLILNEKITKIMLDYTETAYRYSEDNIRRAYQIAKDNKVSNETLKSIIMIEKIDADNCPIIFEESEEIKKLYWKSFKSGMYISNEKTARWVIEEMIKYSTHMCILETLGENKEYFSGKEILEILETVKTIEVGNISQMTKYYTEDLFSKLYDSLFESDMVFRVALLELSYRGLIDVADMKCLNKCLRESPLLLLQIIAYIFKTDDGNYVVEKDLDQNNVSSLFSVYYSLKFCPAEEEGKVDLCKLKKWINDFEEGLKTNNQYRLLDMVLGKLLASSPIGQDGFYPAEEVREIIEERYTKSLDNEYVASICNLRGVYSPTGGKEERKIAFNYKENADNIRCKYPNTAKIYDHLYQQYIYEANSERESDEYAGI